MTLLESFFHAAIVLVAFLIVLVLALIVSICFSSGDSSSATERPAIARIVATPSVAATGAANLRGMSNGSVKSVPGERADGETADRSDRSRSCGFAPG